MPARAVLVLDDALSRHKLEMKLEGESWILILGQALTQYTRQVTENTFRQVTVFPSMDDTANQADVILHPVLGRTEVNLLSSVWEYKQNILLVVEWNLLDHTGKDTLWLRSVAANSNIEGGSLLFQKKRVQIAFQKLFDDLARKTQKAFDESPEIQRLGE